MLDSIVWVASSSSFFLRVKLEISTSSCLPRVSSKESICRIKTSSGKQENLSKEKNESCPKSSLCQFFIFGLEEVSLVLLSLKIGNKIVVFRFRLLHFGLFLGGECLKLRLELSLSFKALNSKSFSTPIRRTEDTSSIEL